MVVVYDHVTGFFIKSDLDGHGVGLLPGVAFQDGPGDTRHIDIRPSACMQIPLKDAVHT